jgi:hypothetical protein
MDLAQPRQQGIDIGMLAQQPIDQHPIAASKSDPAPYPSRGHPGLALPPVMVRRPALEAAIDPPPYFVALTASMSLPPNFALNFW